jgi:hypothetical protein
VTDLPHERLIVGLQIHAADANIVVEDSGPLDTVVGLKMLNHAGDVIFEQRGPLRTWSWTSWSSTPHKAFAYRPGRAEDGTYFTPRRGGRYTIRLDVEPGSERGVPVEAWLQMRGGGWK